MVFSGYSIGVTLAGNIQISGPGEGFSLINSEGTGVGNKLGIYAGKLLGITLVVADRIKLGCEKLSKQFLSGGKAVGRVPGSKTCN